MYGPPARCGPARTTDEDRDEEKSQTKRKAEDIYADFHVSWPFAFVSGYWYLFSGYAGGFSYYLFSCVLVCDDSVSDAV